MANLIPLDQAAKMLGMTPEQITEMRSKNEIFGYRDGSSWKFKMEELQRVADDRGLTLSADDDFELSSEAISDAIKSDVHGSSSDIVIDEDSGDLSFGSSDIGLAADSNVLGDEAKSGESASDTGKIEGEDDLQLAEDDLFDNDLSISDSASFEDSAELSSDFEDSDMVLDDSDSSNEVALEANDSGIDLKPTDSGISLEDEPLELGGSDIDSLELPEDDEVLSLEDASDPTGSALGGGEDDFNLTPLDDALDDPSSGSQVIALEDSEVFADDSAATLLSDSDAAAAQPMMQDSGQQPQMGMDAAGGAIMVQPGAVATLPEHDYSIWNLLSLILVGLLVLAGGMVAFDVARNMWTADGTFSDSILSFFIELFGVRE